MAYDNPIPGFDTRNCINLRLWAAKPSKEFDLEAFNTGEGTARHAVHTSILPRAQGMAKDVTGILLVYSTCLIVCMCCQSFDC